MNPIFKQAYRLIKKSNSILILPHKDADGDALGSAYGLASALISMGKNATVLCEETSPHKLLSVIKGAPNTKIQIEDNEVVDNNLSFIIHHLSFNKPDLAISVDTSDIQRLGSRATLFEQMGEATIAFDHHKTFTNFGHISYVNPSAAACAEVIYEFLTACGIEINPDAANNLYLGISSDTGGFRQSNTTARTMEVGADLMRKGADTGAVNTALFLSNTLTHTLLTAEVLRTLQTFHNDEISLLYITQETLNKLGATDDEAEGLVNFARNIIGVKIAFFLREKIDNNGKHYIKISTRSNADIYDVAKMCETLGGGGHIRAAGAELPHNDMEAAIKDISRIASEFIDNVDKLTTNSEQ